MTVAKTYQEDLERIKENVVRANDYFKPNYERYAYFMDFVFNTSITEADRVVGNSLQKPVLEFNILEAYLSRQYGEFSKHEPSITVTSDDGTPVSPETIQAIEDHLRHIIFESAKDGVQYNTYRESMGGGFSMLKVVTEYASKMGNNAFKQVIKLKKVFNPVLCGFDPYSTAPHKGDADFCYELYPMKRDDFEKQFPSANTNNVNYSRSFEGINWSYVSDREEYIMVCNYFEKKKKRIKIVEIPDGSVMTKDDYKTMIEEWNASGKLEQAPIIVNERWTNQDIICRYILMETEVLSHTETDFESLPIVFFDGNSVVLQHNSNNSFRQMTRPYVYHARDLQRLKNFAGSTLANELENMVQHKFIVKREALPEEKAYLDIITNIQQPGTVIVNAFMEDNPNQPIPDPIREIARVPAPPEVINTFQMMEQSVQGVLGSYDAALGVNDNQLSGVAIIESASQSNATAMPYVVSYLQSLSWAANIMVQIIPKYYTTPRTIPIVRKDGTRAYQKINQPGGIDFNYDSNAMQVKVEAGVNFQIQKRQALEQMISFSKAIPAFGEFVNDDGLDIALDNFDVRGADVLKERAMEWMKKRAAQKQQAEQMQQQMMQNNPQMMKAKTDAARLQHDVQMEKVNAVLDSQKIEIQRMEAQIKHIQAIAGIQDSRVQMGATVAKAHAEEVRATADLNIEREKMHHEHSMNVLEHHHKVESHKEEMKNARKEKVLD
jgi:hypothetical protein